MTRSSSPTLPPDDFDSMRRGSMLLGNMAMFLVVLFLFIFSCMWLFSDISGEYYIPGRGSAVRVSLVRQATTIYGELAYGRGAVLELTSTEPPQNEVVNLVFETPEKWVKQGSPRRQVSFAGTLKDGVLEGQFQEGNQKMKARLERSGINSVYRQIEAHLPWQLYKKWFAVE